MTYAFPVHRPKAPAGSTYSDSMVIDDGMTLRDYFAAKAMQALLSQIETSAGISKQAFTANDIADACYLWADKMLEARK